MNFKKFIGLNPSFIYIKKKINTFFFQYLVWPNAINYNRPSNYIIKKACLIGPNIYASYIT